MGIDLTGVSPDTACFLHYETGVIAFALCGAEVCDGDVVSANQAAYYARHLRQSLANGELERAYAREARAGDRGLENARGQIEEFVKFLERCGGYSVWA
jgi:hypothetical protein